jgi:hypothetical protein
VYSSQQGPALIHAPAEAISKNGNMEKNPGKAFRYNPSRTTRPPSEWCCLKWEEVTAPRKNYRIWNHFFREKNYWQHFTVNHTRRRRASVTVTDVCTHVHTNCKRTSARKLRMQQRRTPPRWPPATARRPGIWTRCCTLASVGQSET